MTVNKHLSHQGFSRRRFLTGAAGAFAIGSRARAQTPAPQKWAYVVDDFSRGTRGWLAGFSDHPLTPENLQRVAEVRRLPEEIDVNRFGYFLKAKNTPDDLFMFLKKPVGPPDGLEPSRSYTVDFRIEFASSAPSDCLGVGGAPGESVWLKAGASTVEPVAVLEDGEVRLNLDKGDQDMGGADATVTGNIANGIPCEQAEGRFVLLERTHRHPRPVTTDEQGWLWIFLGTESGFEGVTAIYYSRIVALLTLVEG